MSDRIPIVIAPVPPRGRKLTAACMFATLVVVVVVAQVVPLPEETHLWKEVLNFGHVVLFGVFAILALCTSTELFASQLHERYQHYLLALAVTVAVGAGTEILQRWAPRDANLADFARNAIGATCFLTLYSVRDGRLAAQWKTIGGKVKHAVIASAAIGLIAAVMPLFMWATAYVYRDYTFPQIVSFGSYWSRMFLQAQNAELVITDPPPGWKTARNRHIARLTLEPARYPGFWVQDLYPDWNGYSFLRFDIYSEMTSSVQLTVRVHDRLHNNKYNDRFNQALRVLPGLNEFRIPIGRIQASPTTRELDLRSIVGLSIFAVHPERPYFIDIDAIWLE